MPLCPVVRVRHCWDEAEFCQMPGIIANFTWKITSPEIAAVTCGAGNGCECRSECKMVAHHCLCYCSVWHNRDLQWVYL